MLHSVFVLWRISWLHILRKPWLIPNEEIRVSPVTHPPQPQRPLVQARPLLPDGPHTPATLINSYGDAFIIG